MACGSAVLRRGWRAPPHSSVPAEACAATPAQPPMPRRGKTAAPRVRLVRRASSTAQRPRRRSSPPCASFSCFFSRLVLWVVVTACSKETLDDHAVAHTQSAPFKPQGHDECYADPNDLCVLLDHEFACCFALHFLSLSSHVQTLLPGLRDTWLVAPRRRHAVISKVRVRVRQLECRLSSQSSSLECRLYLPETVQAAPVQLLPLLSPLAPRAESVLLYEVTPLENRIIAFSAPCWRYL